MPGSLQIDPPSRRQSAARADVQQISSGKFARSGPTVSNAKRVDPWKRVSGRQQAAQLPRGSNALCVTFQRRRLVRNSCAYSKRFWRTPTISARHSPMPSTFGMRFRATQCRALAWKPCAQKTAFLTCWKFRSSTDRSSIQHGSTLLASERVTWPEGVLATTLQPAKS